MLQQEVAASSFLDLIIWTPIAQAGLLFTRRALVSTQIDGLADLRSAKQDNSVVPRSRERERGGDKYSLSSSSLPCSVHALSLRPPCKILAVSPQLIPHAYPGPVILLLPWQHKHGDRRVRCPVRQGERQQRMVSGIHRGACSCDGQAGFWWFLLDAIEILHLFPVLFNMSASPELSRE